MVKDPVGGALVFAPKAATTAHQGRPDVFCSPVCQLQFA
jgi:hypothetical protein